MARADEIAAQAQEMYDQDLRSGVPQEQALQRAEAYIRAQGDEDAGGANYGSKGSQIQEFGEDVAKGYAEDYAKDEALKTSLGTGTGAAAGEGAATLGAAATGGYASVYGGTGVAVAAGEAVPAGYTGVATMANGATYAVPASSTGAGGGAASASWAGPAAVAAIVALNTYQTMKLKKKMGTGLTNDEVQDIWHPARGYEKKIFGDKAVGIAEKFSVGHHVVNALFASGKNDDQIKRERIVGALKKMGVVNENNSLTLADGSNFDIGRDGGFRLKNFSGEGDHPMYSTDGSDPTTRMGIGWAAPIGRIWSGGDKGGSEWMTSKIVNAAQSNSAGSLENVRKNIFAVWQRMGLTNDAAIQMLQGYKADGKISDDEYKASVYALGTLTSGKFNIEQPGENPDHQLEKGPPGIEKKPVTPMPRPVSSR